VQGLPAITVPAGFTTQVWDRIPDPKAPPPKDAESSIPTIVTGPVKARLPVGMDLLGRPFSEPTLLKIAAAFAAGTQHREPPHDYGPLK